ncbi:hypothetical protein [Ekhidna sp.]|uniref:hypothetical protein n=1 Tax=Ekhidna sp. TaxID=2608089 RepID=UPI0032EFC347
MRLLFHFHRLLILVSSSNTSIFDEYSFETIKPMAYPDRTELAHYSEGTKSKKSIWLKAICSKGKSCLPLKDQEREASVDRFNHILSFIIKNGF